MNMKTWFLVAVAVLANASASRAIPIFSPGYIYLGEGNSSAEPFARGSDSMRFQQVYGVDDFLGIPQGGMITRITFRGDGQTGHPFDEVIGSVQINLSTTTKAPDGLSTIFSENVGANDTIVFGPGPLRVIGEGGVSGQVSWGPVIYLAQPFYYSPSLGNLLLDIRTFTGGGPVPLDAVAYVGDSVSILGSGEVNAPTGYAYTLGLATAFEITPVPEPGVAVLVGLGVLALGARACFKHGKES